MAWAYRNVDDLPSEIPVFPLADCLLLPRCDLPLNIFEPRYLAMVDAALKGSRLIGMIQPQTASPESQAPVLAPIGCVGRIVRYLEADERYLISLKGVCRFRIQREVEAETPFRVFSVDFAEFRADLGQPENVDAQDRRSVIEALWRYADAHAIQIDREAIEQASDELLINALSMMSPFGAQGKQTLLEAKGLRERANALVRLADLDAVPTERNRSRMH